MKNSRTRSRAQFRLVDIKFVEISMTIEAHFWLVDIKFLEKSMTIEARFWLVDIRKDKNFLFIIARFWLDDFFSARLNSISILIFFNVKNNWLISLLFLFTFIHFLRLFNSSYLKVWYIINLPFNLSELIEMPSLNRNERIACLECGRKQTRLHASRHRRSCNCNFHTYSSEELTNNFKMKHCQHNANLCDPQSPNTVQDKVKLIVFIKNIEFTMNISFHWIWKV